jgi:hypothetical protein
LAGASADPVQLVLTPIRRVESELTDPGSAPTQGDEGAPDAWLVIEPALLPALDGIRVRDELVVGRSRESGERRH